MAVSSCSCVIPVLRTKRLTLSQHEAADLDPAAAMWSDPAIVRYIGARPFSREEVWHRILRYIGHWNLLGFGYWAIRDGTTGQFIGEIGFADWRREAFPNLHGLSECGWVLATAAQGFGYAAEALQAVLAWSDHVQLGRTICLIDEANVCSIRLAMRFGYTINEENTKKRSNIMIFDRTP